MEEQSKVPARPDNRGNQEAGVNGWPEEVRPEGATAAGGEPQAAGAEASRNDRTAAEAHSDAADGQSDVTNPREPGLQAAGCFDAGAEGSGADDAKARPAEVGHLPYTVFGAIPENEETSGHEQVFANDPSACADGSALEDGAHTASGRSGRSTDEGESASGTAAFANHNQDLGRRGEQAAARFLERRGMEILERNWVCAAGEADIIAHDGEAIHFVEVKTRSNIAHGFPSEAVTPEKRSRYERIAAIYLSRHEYVDISVLFDIISIVVTGPNRAFLRYHRNAYASCE